MNTLAGIFFGIAFVAGLAVLTLAALGGRKPRCPGCGRQGVEDRRFDGLWWCTRCARAWGVWS